MNRFPARLLGGILLVVAIVGCGGDNPCSPDGKGGNTVCSGSDCNSDSGCKMSCGGAQCHTNSNCTCATWDNPKTYTKQCSCWTWQQVQQ